MTTKQARKNSGENSTHGASRKRSIRSKPAKRLSDGALLARLEKSRGIERAVQRRIVCDLAEVERRRLYLPKGYGSLFEFCTDCLGYSRSSAGPLTDTAPPDESLEQAGAPRDGAEPPAVDTANAGPDGASEYRDCSHSTPSAGSKMAQLIDNIIDKNRDVHSGGGACTAGAGATSRIVTERKFKLQFAVDPEFMEKLASIRSLLSTKYPGKIRFEMIFEILMSEYLERPDPERRHRRRKDRKARAGKETSAVKSAEEPSEQQKVSKQDTKSARRAGRDRGGIDPPGGIRRSTGRGSGKRSRHIPQEIRDEVFVRDGGRCTFVGTNGRRCEERNNLQIISFRSQRAALTRRRTSGSCASSTTGSRPSWNTAKITWSNTNAGNDQSYVTGTAHPDNSTDRPGYWRRLKKKS